jgi:hypothetical protein
MGAGGKTMSYQDFLKSKQRWSGKSGFVASELSGHLFPFQKAIVGEALDRGKFGVFADCGLGKTLMELEWAKEVAGYLKRPVLIACPLAVTGQTIKEASKFGYASVDRAGKDTAIQVINYDQLHTVNSSEYAGIVLDESSILKNYEGAYRNMIIENYHQTPFKLAGTATPAPNDPMELGNHSEFLNKMSRSEMLAMYYVHDGGNTAKWRIKGHAAESYYTWVRSWATMLRKPSDIGFNDQGYDLPDLRLIEHQIKTKQRAGKLFNDVAVSATTHGRELRETLKDRMELAAGIVNGSEENFVVWVNHNEEGKLISKMIPGSVEVSGSDSPEYKEEMLLGFAENQFRVLVTKPKIASFGLNWQNCHNTVFASIDFSWERIYQALRRFLRFGQLHDVNAHLITTDTMQNAVQSFWRKQKQHEQMQYLMTKSIAT